MPSDCDLCGQYIERRRNLNASGIPIQHLDAYRKLCRQCHDRCQDAEALRVQRSKGNF
jgi:hypothetical protein